MRPPGRSCGPDRLSGPGQSSGPDRSARNHPGKDRRTSRRTRHVLRILGRFASHDRRCRDPHRHRDPGSLPTPGSLPRQRHHPGPLPDHQARRRRGEPLEDDAPAVGRGRGDRTRRVRRRTPPRGLPTGEPPDRRRRRHLLRRRPGARRCGRRAAAERGLRGDRGRAGSPVVLPRQCLRGRRRIREHLLVARGRRDPPWCHPDGRGPRRGRSHGARDRCDQVPGDLRPARHGQRPRRRRPGGQPRSRGRQARDLPRDR